MEAFFHVCAVTGEKRAMEIGRKAKIQHVLHRNHLSALNVDFFVETNMTLTKGQSKHDGIKNRRLVARMLAI